MTKLKVYKASAGSGKTFKLTEEYLLMLFKNPYAFKQILAVTFTNKATAEMKQRIIEHLYLLSQQKETPYKNIIEEYYKLSEDQIVQKAGFILELILHDYSRFSIETIDSFFQKILRAFIKDVGFNTGFSIELNNDLVLSESIETLLKEKTKDNKRLKKWISDLIDQRMSDEKSWNVRGEIEKLGKEIFKEKVQNISHEFWKKINDEDFLRAYEKELYQVQYGFENQIEKLATNAIEIINNHQLDKTDFKGKSRAFTNIFYKLKNSVYDLPNPTAVNAVDDVDKWYGSDKTKHDQILSAYNAGLNKTLSDIITLFKNEFVRYNSAKSILNFIYSLGIIGDLTNEIHRYTKEKNIFLLSDATYLLKNIIGENDSSFIYEKTGTFFKSFMIDEFQDTSQLQWENFKPLIINSLAEGNQSLVVGDVKQSIYRWRNGDWTILGEEVARIFDINEIGLDTNYRSFQQIVDFNNELFQFLPEIFKNQLNGLINEAAFDDQIVAEKIERAYFEPGQSFVKDKAEKGYLELNFLTEEEFKENQHNYLKESIIKLQNNGYEAKDIAILVRTNREGQKVADMLLSLKNDEELKSYCFDVISNDSLFIKYSQAVQLIIASLKYIEQPWLNIYKYELLSQYYSLYGKLGEIANISMKEFEENDEKFFELLPSGFKNLLQPEHYYSLFHLIENIIEIFKITDTGIHNAYVISFLDIVSDFSDKNYTDIPSFMEYWDKNKDKYTIQAPENINAIRIMTIHKSKGLQFKAVVLPFLNWKVGNIKKDSILWCVPNEAPFSKLEIVPVMNSSKLQHSIFAKDYFYELMQDYIDNLNLLYVAFTRAEEALISFSNLRDENKRKKRKRIDSIGEFVFEFLQLKKLDKIINEEVLERYISGEIDRKEQKENAQVELSYIDKYLVYDNKDKIRIALHSDSFYEEGISDEKNFMEHGNLMHQIFSLIERKEDVENAIDSTIQNGNIRMEERQKYIDKFNELITKSEVKEWFSKKYTIKNEASILLRNGRSKRPDRIMLKDSEAIVVDYKFAHEEDLQYHMQVKTYIELLQELGYKKVSGYLWYVFQDKVVKI